MIVFNIVFEKMSHLRCGIFFAFLFSIKNNSATRCCSNTLNNKYNLYRYDTEERFNWSYHREYIPGN